jgi:hypothetical protein
MTTIKLNDATARSIYPTADANLKKILDESFGAAFFKQKITDRIKTFEDALEALNLATCDVYTNVDTADERAYKQLKIIVKALNEGWTPDWNNSSEAKYYPWFEYKKGIGFVFDCCGYYYQTSLVGSRLCFKNRELAEYAAKQFQTIYNDFLTIH